MKNQIADSILILSDRITAAEMSEAFELEIETGPNPEKSAVQAILQAVKECNMSANAVDSVRLYMDDDSQTVLIRGRICQLALEEYQSWVSKVSKPENSSQDSSEQEERIEQEADVPGLPEDPADMSEEKPEEEISQPEPVQKNSSPIHINKEKISGILHKKGWIAGIAAVLILIVVAAIAMNSSSKDSENQTETAGKEQTQEETETLSDEQTQANPESAYYETLVHLYGGVLLGNIEADSMASLFSSVWYNCIFEKSDSETDPYTKKNGSFYDDFNDALYALETSQDWQDDEENLLTTRNNVKGYLKDLKNPPEDFEDVYEKATEMVEAFLDLSDIVLYPSGNYETYVKNYNEAGQKLSSTMNSFNLALDLVEPEDEV